MNLSKKINSIRAVLASKIPFALLRRRDVRFPHAVGVVVSASAEIGSEVVIFQNVTIGGKEGGSRPGFPRIGDRVTIYAGACVLGAVTVGEGAVIGANVTVTKDVPPGAVVVADAPMRFLGR